jgi:hypothetical protein
MGQQIVMTLSIADEQRLIDHLTKKFPHCRVVNAIYPEDWDRRTMDRAEDAQIWLIIDSRTIPILLESAWQITGAQSKPWQIRSKARSCIEWSRDLCGIGYGRLYLNTTPDLIWLDISAETGDDIERMFRSARTWVRANCVNCSKHRHGIWVSPCKEQEFREARAKRHAESINRQKLDPRDKRYYELQRKNKARLTAQEITVYISYCDKMVAYFKDNATVVVHWQQFKRELEERRADKLRKEGERRRPTRRAR